MYTSPFKNTLNKLIDLIAKVRIIVVIADKSNFLYFSVVSDQIAMCLEKIKSKEMNAEEKEGDDIFHALSIVLLQVMTIRSVVSLR